MPKSDPDHARKARRKPAPAPPRALDLRILRALRRIIQAVDIHSNKLASRHQITTPQLVTLLCVTEEGPLTPSDIAARVHLANSTVVGILDRLEAKALIQRTRGETDRRQVFVQATPAGHALAQSAPSPLQDTFADALHRLPELEQTAIALSLERIVELMEARDLDAAPVLTPGAMLPPGDA
jgi:DNA-binding MarR family transcriptional regulator